jgi:outer membrane protein assembly factor BamB
VARTRSLILLAGFALLTACEREQILEGERLGLRALTEGEPAAVVLARSVPITLPAPVTNSEWTHRNGGVTHAITHPALGSRLTRAWSSDIGQGEGRRHRITAEPVVAGGRIFTLDSQATVTATATEGGRLWQRDLTPGFARRGNASGGGLAHGAGRLFVTTAFGTLVALDPATGEEIWTQRFDAPVTGAPAVVDDRVYVVSGEGVAWAVDVEDGRLRWRITGVPSPSAMVGGPAPAVTGRMVLFPFPSGDLVASLRDSGVEAWRRRIAGRREGQAYAMVSDITGDPVVVGNTVYVGNQSGRTMALDLDSGAVRWDAREGSYGPVWPVAGAVFLLNDRGELVRLDAATGERVWGVELPYYTRDRERRRAEIYAHYGPVLAGGRLIVASNDGVIRGFDPASGELVEQVEIPRGATTSPVVAGGTLYLVSADGRLHAYR